jgi:hypothetical protein
MYQKTPSIREKMLAFDLEHDTFLSLDDDRDNLEADAGNLIEVSYVMTKEAEKEEGIFNKMFNTNSS